MAEIVSLLTIVVRRGVLGAAVGGLLVAFASSTIDGCSPRALAPRGGASASDPVPGQRLRGASLFGTDIVGLPTGATLTPDATPGARLFALDPHVARVPGLRAGGAIATALSPDGGTLLLLTSGYNRSYDEAGKPIPEGSSEYVFVYDVSAGAPRETQVLAVANSFGGVAFHPRGDRFFVNGGPDDVVHEFARDEPRGAFVERAPAIALGHLDARGFGGLGIDVSPFAAGLALDERAGDRLVAANHENDSLSIIDTGSRARIAEVSLGAGAASPGGEFPWGVLVLSDRRNTAPEGLRAFVTSQRDREVVEVDVAAARVVGRIRVGGQPTSLIANRAESRIYVANANSDSVSVIDVATRAVVSEIRTSAPEASLAPLVTLRGSNPNALALSPDERTLYVTNGGNNDVAVIDLSARDRGEADGANAPAASRVHGLVPTGFYPNAVTVSRDGLWLYVAFGKSPTGPNPGGPWSDVTPSSPAPRLPGKSNQFSLELQEGGLLALPTPSDATLAKLTAQSLLNNRFAAADLPFATEPRPSLDAGPSALASLRGVIKHVIYVVGENRTYDQLFGDLAGADGDPRLLHWGEAITPNHHALARAFVTLDRFFDAGGVSGDGWQWSMSGRTTDVAEKAIPLEYANRGHHSYDWEGKNRNINVGLPTLAERIEADPRTPNAPDLLPGTGDVGAVDGPLEGGRGFLWDAVMARGLTVRNYGAFVDDALYGLNASDPANVPALRMPFDTKTRVAVATRTALLAATDPSYRGFDMTFADFWRVSEWAREFDAYVAHDDLPALEIVRLPHDHLGKFDKALDGVNTPDTQIADHDYALGLLVERVSKSPRWDDTVVIALEDDAQDGADHVDAHRSFVLFAGGHVRRGAVVSTVYSTPSVLRTIELLLGVAPLGQADAFARPMGEVWSAEVDRTPFVAIVPGVLRTTALPLPPAAPGARAMLPRGDAVSWALATKGFDFDEADALPAARWNRVLYCGLVDGAGCTSESTPRVCAAADKE